MDTIEAIEGLGTRRIAWDPIFVSTGQILRADFSGGPAILRAEPQELASSNDRDHARAPLTYRASDSGFETSDRNAPRYLQIDGERIRLEMTGSPHANYYAGTVSTRVAGQDVSFEVTLFPEGAVKVLGNRSIFVEGLGAVALNPVYQNRGLQVNAEASVEVEGKEVVLEGYADRSALHLTGTTNVLEGGPAVPLTLNYTTERGLSQYRSSSNS